jgi:poly-gamma-glutamate synthesis protein (capsule biosynthesis protein)
LVIALNIHRPALDLSARRAENLAKGGGLSWSELGQPGGRVTVVQGAGSLPRVVQELDTVALVPASRVRPTVQVASIAGVDPLTDPAAYPLQVRSRHALPEITTMTMVGDIMLGRRVGAASPEDPGRALGPMSRRLARADITVGNLESTLSMAGPPQQDDSFAADPAVVPALLAAGFDLVSMANNHTGDYGPTALVETFDRLRQRGLRSVGAGPNLEQARSPVILRRDKLTFAFLAFNAIGETPRATAHRPGAVEIRMQPRTGPLNESDVRHLSTEIGRLSKWVDVITVIPHWGDQYTHVPVRDQRRVGRALVDAGADLVAGGHPHWVQGVQPHRGTLIVHSLGNFVFDMDFSEETQEGVMLDLVFWGGDVKAARFVPYVIGPDFAPRVVKGPRAAAILGDVWSSSRGAFRE